MHNAHNHMLAEKDDNLAQHAQVASRLEEAESVNDALAEEVLRLRLARGQETAAGHEQCSHTPQVKASRSPPPTTSRAHSHLLAQALARENRRLRTASRAAAGGSNG